MREEPPSPATRRRDRSIRPTAVGTGGGGSGPAVPPAGEGVHVPGCSARICRSERRRGSSVEAGLEDGAPPRAGKACPPEEAPGPARVVPHPRERQATRPGCRRLVSGRSPARHHRSRYFPAGCPEPPRRDGQGRGRLRAPAVSAGPGPGPSNAEGGTSPGDASSAEGGTSPGDAAGARTGTVVRCVARVMGEAAGRLAARAVAALLGPGDQWRAAQVLLDLLLLLRHQPDRARVLSSIMPRGLLLTGSLVESSATCSSQ